MQTLASEVRIAARRLLRAPAFTLVAIVTLALGIGAATAIYTLLDAIALRPLPYPESERLVRVQHPVPGQNPDWVWQLSEAGYHHFAGQSSTLEALAVYSEVDATLSGDDGAEPVDAVIVSASMFTVLQATPAVGRLMRPEENLPGAAKVALLGHDFWRARFGGDSGIIGRTVLIAEEPHEIIGVLAAGVHMPDHEVSVWLPFPLDPSARPMNSHWLAAIGRLRDGVAPAEAEAELARMTAQFPELYPTAYSPEFMRSSRFSVQVTPLRDVVVGDAARTLWILLGSVAVVLLIALANAANLFLVRAEGRRRELAVRTALGATPGSLARHYLTESLLVAAAAAVVAVWLAHEGLALLVALAPEGIPRLGEVAVGARSVLAATAIAAGAGLLLGLIPLARTRGSSDAVREGGRGMTASRRQHAVRGALVTAQVALALVLLAAAGLMLHSFRNLRAVSPGFDARGVLAVDIALPETRYSDYERVAGFYRELEERVTALPGVTGAGMTQRLPLATGVGCASVFIKDKPLAPGETPPCVGNPQVGPGFFATMGIPVRGRAPDWTDTYRASGEVVVSQALAERLWPGEDALGKEVRGGWPGDYYRVVGVAGDVRQDGLDQPPAEAVYYPLLPRTGQSLWMPPVSGSFVVRTGLARPAELGPAVRRIVREIDPGAATAEIRPMTAVVSRSMARASFTLMLLGIAGTMALVLSAVGLYGVLAYMVSRRTSEIGIRMALGARAEQVVRLVLGHSVRMVVAGIVIGIAMAAVALRALRSVLFGVEPLDPVTLAVAAAVLLAVGMLAAWLPARRATRVSPVTALQSE